MANDGGNVTRVEALRVMCPKCGAAPGHLCVGARNPPQTRKQVHQERVTAAAAARRHGAG
jgi:hypothetical protein